MRGITLFLSILAVFAAGVSAMLFMLIGNEKQSLQRELAAVRSQIESARQGKTEISSERDEMAATLERQTRELNELKAHNVSLEARNNQLARDVTNARDQLATRESMEAATSREIADLRQQLVDAKSAAATATGGASAEQVAAYEARIANLETQLALARQSDSDAEFAAALARVPEDLTGSVLEVGPKSAFVVLDIGTRNGAIPELEMILRRGSRVIATVRLTEVHDSYSVAHVLPASTASRIRTGDVASRS